jgi:hypothetical protein
MLFRRIMTIFAQRGTPNDSICNHEPSSTVFTVMASIRASLKSSIFWDITPCSLLKINQGVEQVASTAHSVIFQKTDLFITTAVRTSDSSVDGTRLEEYGVTQQQCVFIQLPNHIYMHNVHSCMFHIMFSNELLKVFPNQHKSGTLMKSEGIIPLK